jgi:hypothetical protein
MSQRVAWLSLDFCRFPSYPRKSLQQGRDIDPMPESVSRELIREQIRERKRKFWDLTPAARKFWDLTPATPNAKESTPAQRESLSMMREAYENLRPEIDGLKIKEQHRKVLRDLNIKDRPPSGYGYETFRTKVFRP